MRAVAAEKKVSLIDMHRKTEKVIKQYGVGESRKLFLQLKPDENSNYPKGIEDNTHFNPMGASWQVWRLKEFVNCTWVWQSI